MKATPHGVRSMCRSFRSVSVSGESTAQSMVRHCRAGDRAVSAKGSATSVGSRCATMSCTALPGFQPSRLRGYIS